MSNGSEATFGFGFGTALVLGGITAICLMLYGCPQYLVYEKRLSGEAELAHAQYSRRVVVQTAQAKMDASKLEAQTDVIRAEGVAGANKILAESLGGPAGYLRWKYIEMLETTGNKGRDVIYVPTEGNLPILEAGRRPEHNPDHE